MGIAHAEKKLEAVRMHDFKIRPVNEKTLHVESWMTWGHCQHIVNLVLLDLVYSG